MLRKVMLGLPGFGVWFGPERDWIGAWIWVSNVRV
jgi:hypothetical protein